MNYNKLINSSVICAENVLLTISNVSIGGPSFIQKLFEKRVLKDVVKCASQVSLILQLQPLGLLSHTKDYKMYLFGAYV